MSHWLTYQVTDLFEEEEKIVCTWYFYSASWWVEKALYMFSSGYTFINKSRIRETPTLSTDVDSKTDKILERLRDFSKKKEKRFSFERFCEFLFNFF